MKNWTTDAVSLTQAILRHHYNCDFLFVLKYLSEDIMWIGPLESQFIQGKSNLRKIFLAKQNSPAMITDEHYFLVNSSTSFCIVACKIQISTLPDTKLALNARQQYSFFWRLQKGMPLITHIHCSNTWDYITDKETFPYEMGRRAYQTFSSILRKEQQSIPLIRICDTNKRTYFITQKDIIYVEASGKDCIVNCINSSFRVHISISRFTNYYKLNLKQIHRSFLVNCRHIKSVQRFSLTMKNNITIPIPEKRYRKVREMIFSELSND